MERMDKRDMMILSYLRQNSRKTLTKLSRLTQIPVSTIFDKLKDIEGLVITKHTTLLDFNKLGFTVRANLFIEVKKDKKADLGNYLIKHQNVNNLHKINNGYDFLAEVVFKSINELEMFKDSLEDKFGVKNVDIYYIIEDIKREAFMADPSLVDLIVQ